MDYLHACSTLKNEADYLAEWIAFHRGQGIQHFHLYDNGSEDHPETVLEKLGRHDITLYKTSGPRKQLEAYNDCLDRLRGKSTWLAFLDLDEFIVPAPGETLPGILQDFEDPHYGGLGIHWQCFGSSGHEERPEGLQTEAYRFRAPIDWPWWNWHVKSIVRPERVFMMTTPHHATYLQNFFPVTERHEFLNGPFACPASVQRVQVNHYFTRSRREFCRKILRGGGMGNNKSMVHFYEVDRASFIEDRRALRFLPALRRELAARGFALPPM